MTASTMMLFMVLNALSQWEFSHVEHLNGDGARAYCEQMRQWKDEAYRGQPGDMKVICGDDHEVRL